ncbi:hypothetical protein [Desulfatibacillum aliphaticivorans]|uniref:hypothetical protein n=1 Tax=Desulfatibacillum aliphaticivorans TaxID=218208 RepID=UPI00041D91A2|nr:hypothetical protein [Desulfatibacillum aliphaticivorans]
MPHSLKLILAAALCLLALPACKARNNGGPDAAPDVEFTRQGLTLQFENPVPVSMVEVLDSQGGVVLRQRFQGRPKKSLSLPMSWEPQALYTVQTGLKEGAVKTSVRAPRELLQGAAVHFAVPYSGRETPFSLKGLEESGEKASSAVQGAAVTGGLILRHYGHVPADYAMTISLPGELALLELPQNAKVVEEEDGRTLHLHARMEAYSQLAYFVFRVMAEGNAPVTCRARVVRKDGAGESVYTRVVVLSPIPMKEFRRRVQAANAQAPVSAKGLFDAKNQPDTLFFGTKIFRQLGRILGTTPPPQNNFAPYTHQAVSLFNSGKEELSVLVTSRIVAHQTDRTPEAFYPPDRFTGKLKDQSAAVSATLPPQQSTTVIIPIFINGTPNPGIYDRKISIYPMGASLPVHEIVRPLYVTGTNLIAACVVCGSLILSLGGLIFFVLNFKKLIASASEQDLVVISFFGAVTFAGVNVPLRIFNSVITALFGPFAVLVLGFFNDLVYFSMLIALLRLIPRPGVATLTYLVRYLLAGMMLGGFHVLDFLYMGTALVLKESALYASGITRKGDQFEWTWFNTLAAALLLGAADALLNASSVYLHVIFYRLYFARWYIFLSILFNGFVYTGIGVYFGKRFSNTLKMVQE